VHCDIFSSSGDDENVHVLPLEPERISQVKYPAICRIMEFCCSVMGVWEVVKGIGRKLVSIVYLILCLGTQMQSRGIHHLLLTHISDIGYHFLYGSDYLPSLRLCVGLNVSPMEGQIVRRLLFLR
jgi:hypothetical protein